MNGDQRIEESEFISAYSEMNPHLDRATSIAQAIQIFKAADTDMNGSISFSEGCAAGIDLHQR